MKILFFSPYFYPYTSGVTTYPFKILSHLAKANRVTVLTFAHKKNLQPKERVGDLNIIRMSFLFKVSKGFISLQALSQFYNQAKKSDLLILNIPNFEGFPLAIFARLLNKKIVSIFHCQVFLGDNPISRIINFLLNLSVYLQLFLSNIIVAYTEDYFDSISLGKIFKYKTKFILPPIEKLPLSVKKIKELKKLKGKNIWLGYAGRISQEKGLEYLINVFHSRGERENHRALNPDRNQIIFAGPFGKEVAGEFAYFTKIKSLLEKKKIKYHFLGNLSAGDLGAFYKSIDVLVLPSINQTEAFGMVQAEAMVQGTPVISVDLPGVRSAINLTGMGIVIQPKNVTQLSQSIERIIKNKTEFTNLVLIKKAQKIFAINNTYKFYNDLINHYE